MKKQEFFDESITEEIRETQLMCKTNMGGYWELKFLPFSGGFYEQPAHIIERKMKIIHYINSAIKKKQDQEDNKNGKNK